MIANYSTENDNGDTNYSVGDVDGPNDSNIWIAGIKIDGWGNAIECYGQSREQAVKRRDTTLLALATLHTLTGRMK